MTQTVLVTRPLVQAREFAEDIKNKNFIPLIQPLLKIEKIPFSFDELEKPDAVLITSIHGLGDKKPPENWSEIPVFTVGLKTEGAARYHGFKKIYSGHGDINDIFPLIKKDIPNKKRILYLRGEHIQQDIHQELSHHRIEEKITYSAKAIDTIENDVLNSFEKIDILTLFSARSGQILKNLLQKHGLLLHVTSIKLLCLSHAVLESVEDLNWASCYVADHPTTTSMIETLERIRNE